MSEITPITDVGHFNIAIVSSRFNQEVSEKLQQGAVERLRDKGFSNEQLTVVWVPGAIEIPITAQALAQTDRYAAIICIGAVIRGETSHYDYVCEQVSQGCQKVALEYNLPVIFGVLTTENEEQALARAGGKHGHKGHEAADAAIDMISIINQIRRLKS